MSREDTRLGIGSKFESGKNRHAANLQGLSRAARKNLHAETPSDAALNNYLKPFAARRSRESGEIKTKSGVPADLGKCRPY
jgi:hypothetical protein